MNQDNHSAGYRRFRQAMQDGVLRPGMVVTQNDLCSILGLSLTPLRETLVLLEEYGLVEIKSRAGIRVIYPEVAFIRENFQFRSLIELHAIRVYCPTAPRDWLDSMFDRQQRLLDLLTNDKMEEAKKLAAELDPELHMTFVHALQNQAIAAVYLRIMDNINLARQVHDRTAFRKRILDSTHEHLAIIESLRHGDAEAAANNLELHFQASTYRTIVAA